MPVLQLLGVVLAIPLVLSCDAMVLFLTGPVCLKGFVNGMAGEEGFQRTRFRCCGIRGYRPSPAALRNRRRFGCRMVVGCPC